MIQLLVPALECGNAHVVVADTHEEARLFVAGSAKCTVSQFRIAILDPRW